MVLYSTVRAVATLGNRFGFLQDGAIVASDLLPSQKGTLLLAHPMLPPNIGSPRDAATLGEIGSSFSALMFCHYKQCFVSVSCIYTAKKGRGGCNVVTHTNFLLVWPRSQITLVGTVRSFPPPVWVRL